MFAHLVLALTLLFGLLAAPLGAVDDAGARSMVGCAHAEAGDTGKTIQHSAADSRHALPDRPGPVGCCIGSACTIGGILPEPLAAAARSVVVETTVDPAAMPLSGVAVPPPFDPPRRSG